MISIKINGIKFLVKPQTNVLEACKNLGIYIPRFCYHETLSIAGNCRMCLVEIEGAEKPAASCVVEVEEGMSIWTDSSFVQKARENVMETLLINHPLDCPICDQGGECDLQDQAKTYGSDRTRYFFNKRGVEDKECGPLIKTIMTRCIHCTRCVRYGSEIAGIDYLGTLNRGTKTEIGTYISYMFESEISGNVIDLCPVGALTSKPYAFKARPWELRLTETVDTTDSLGSNIYVNFKETEIFRILPKNNSSINDSFIDDKTRFSYDSIKNNRIQEIFLKKGSNYSNSNWRNLFELIDKTIIDKKIVLVVDSSIGLETLTILKTLTYKYNGNLKVLCTDEVLNKTNVILNRNDLAINSIKSTNDICILFSSNPKIESSILNAKIRVRYKESQYNIYSLGQTFQYNIPSTFLSLNINSIVKMIEGKCNTLSEILAHANKPLIVISDSIGRRISLKSVLMETLKKFFPNTTTIDIRPSCNSNGIKQLNISPINKKEVNRADIFFFINVNDTYCIKKLLQRKLNTVIWMNTHGSKSATRSQIIIPTMTNFECEEIFINLENRPQKTQKTFNQYFLARPVKNIIKALFNEEIKDIADVKFLQHITEMVKIPDLFNSLNKSSFNQLELLRNSTQFSSYPLKSNLEDFYLSNTNSKNSIVMNNCSKIIRKNNQNFPKF